MPYKATREELEMTKRYLNLDDRVNTRLLKESVIKGRRHTTDFNQTKNLIKRNNLPSNLKI